MAPAAQTPVILRLGEQELTVSHPEKPLWPDAGITKLQYVQTLAQLAPYMLPHCENRYLTTIRHPEGVGGTSFYQKNAPQPTPSYVRTAMEGSIRYVVLDSLPALLWMGSLYALEFHVSCERIGEPLPDRWILDIDPSLEEEPRIMEAAAAVGELLHSLGLEAVPKTSGATGVQVVMPIVRGPTYDQLRSFGKFVSEYLAAKYPGLFTVARFKKERGTLIYLDYLQHHPGRTLAAPYTPRARPGAPVSTPLTWAEIGRNPKPTDFHLLNIVQRVNDRGDLIAQLQPQNLEAVLRQIKTL
ncbi:non-homologous end-joining DNA ligase [Cohnella nanjingensis]|uniref:DNA polymerase domain-containing protein n=1 Tax=Cohnella nanjingensis TaxID=1387779 RepID=A0A7X0RQH1_9BACL|nr:non-homologous end-joining DNA ligase [Cohnella nanjingensis]MBB6671676.1 DNA polymerase domain-containing protein [Cohnella nanjingensis]